MLTIALVVFGLAAVVGATLVYMRIVKKGLIHAFGDHTRDCRYYGLVLLILGVMQMESPGSKASLVTFIIAALGGFTLFSFHLRSRPLFRKGHPWST